MIATTLKDIGRYRNLSANLKIAIDWLLAGEWKNLPDGKYPIRGESIHASIQSYSSKPADKCRFEAHRDYIDIQILVSGAEIMELRTVEGFAVTEPYKPDIEFYATPSTDTAHKLLFSQGIVAIFFPEDAHRPGLAVGGVSVPVRKLVIKVAVQPSRD
jgi:biofilm protein TabA